MVQGYTLKASSVYLRFLNKENIRLKFQYFPEHTSLNMGIKCRIKSISHLQHVPVINIVWTKYNDPRLYGNGKTYIITKLDIVKATGNTNTNVSPSEARKKVDTQVLFLTWDQNWRRTNNTMNKSTNNDLQNIHMKSSNTNPTKNWGVNSGAPEGLTVPAPLVAPIELI